jgi:hypothetical protein
MKGGVEVAGLHEMRSEAKVQSPQEHHNFLEPLIGSSQENMFRKAFRNEAIGKDGTSLRDIMYGPAIPTDNSMCLECYVTITSR